MPDLDEPFCALICRRSEIPAISRLVEAAESAGLALRTVHPDAASGEPRPSVALPRLPSGGSLGRLGAWAAQGVPYVNSPAAIAATHDKPGALARLAEAGFTVPPTVVVTRHAAATLDDLPGDRFIVKPERGAAGRGVTVGWTRDEASARARAFAELSGPVLVQPQLGAGVDRRLFLIDGEVAATMERVPAPGDGRASLLYGGTARAFAPSPVERDLALRAARTLDLDVAGVDLLMTGDGPIVLEVNACPGLTGIEALTGIDLAGAIIRACRKRLDVGRS